MATFTLNEDVLNRVLAEVHSVFNCSIEGVTKKWEKKQPIQLKREIEKMKRNERIRTYFNEIRNENEDENELEIGDINIEFFEMENSPEFSIFTFNDFVVILDCNAKAGNAKMNVVFPIGNDTSLNNHLTLYKKEMDKCGGCVPGETYWHK